MTNTSPVGEVPSRWSQWLRRLPASGPSRLALWLLLWFLLFTMLRLLPGSLGVLSAVLQVMTGLVLLFVGLPWVWKLIRRRLLWSLRNKLYLTYLLVGLAPVVLFVTLVLVSAYIAAGQFAIHLADTRLQSELDKLSAWNAVDTESLASLLATRTDSEAGREWRPTPALVERKACRHLGAFLGSVEIPLQQLPCAERRTPLGLPPWAVRLAGETYQGLTLDGGELFLVSVRERSLADGRRLSLVSSLSVDRDLMHAVAHGLGRVGLVGVTTDSMPVMEPRAGERGSGRTSAGKAAAKQQLRVTQDQFRRISVFGGTEPAPANFADLRVRFLSTLPSIDWDSGSADNVPIEVDSRPSRLYQQLFGVSLGGLVTRVLRVALVTLCVVFALIELLALWAATRLSQTVTASVADLYEATQRIDRGDLLHTIPVQRDDQMADLSRSFNRMTASLQRLLLEQKANERLQNEISIAQEVQANLFPQSEIDLPTLELHGICRPARSVSGDYYDFLLFDLDGGYGNGLPKSPTGVGLALGDISGKGISAALLMATLHSAVRAYRFASEELLSLPNQRGPNGEESVDWPRVSAERFESPGEILGLLNRHLYRSTQPEKYATLFLAHYETSTGRLTYSNAGQLPPLLLRMNGSVERLNCGGTVVGLMDGMTYEQGSVVMQPGDLLVAYSDGVTEPENDFGDFGEERMMEVVRRYRGAPLHVISSEVMQALDAWIGAEEQPDDITLVLARQR